MPEVQLVYASVARTALTQKDQWALMRTSSRHNADRGITGMLLYANDAFLQGLEGPRSAVNALYNRIVRDPRHDQCEVLHYRETPGRRFSDWSMKLQGLAPDSGRERLRRALIRDVCGSEEFDPRRLSGDRAATLLHELAHLERRLEAQPIR